MIEPKTYDYFTNFVSEQTWIKHIQLYHGYVDIVNRIQTLQISRGTKTIETYALNGVILHELFFENIGFIEYSYNTRVKHSDKLNLYHEGFNYDIWEKEFIDVAMLARGWTIFGYDLRSNILKTILLDEHDKGPVFGIIPILVLDLYEHARIYDYANDKKLYIETFLQCILWDIVYKRLDSIKNV